MLLTQIPFMQMLGIILSTTSKYISFKNVFIWNINDMIWNVSVSTHKRSTI